MNIKTWQERITTLAMPPTRNEIESEMQAEIGELRAALKAQPVQEPAGYAYEIFTENACNGKKTWQFVMGRSLRHDAPIRNVDKLYTTLVAQPVQPALISDLSMMVRRLVLSIRRLAEDDTKDLTFANACLDWLKEKGLAGSPLREGPLGAQPAPLSDAQIDQIWLLNGGGLAANRYHDFARAIEAAVRTGGAG